MALQFYDSPFHVTHPEDIASKMAMKMDLSIMLSSLIEKKGWSQKEAANNLGVTQPRISDLNNAKIEKFTLDAMFDMLDLLGFHTVWDMPNLTEATISLKSESAV